MFRSLFLLTTLGLFLLAPGCGNSDTDASGDAGAGGTATAGTGGSAGDGQGGAGGSAQAGAGAGGTPQAGAGGTAQGGAGSAGTAQGGAGTGGAGGQGQGGQLPNVVDGTINGKTITIADAIFIAGTPGGGVQELLIDLEDQAGVCDRIKANTFKQNTTELGFTIAIENASGAVPVGTYSNGTTGKTHLNGGVQEPDPTCMGKHLGTKSGTVTITSISPDIVSGTFDLTLDGGDHVTGSFGATRCDMDIAKITAQACVP